MSNSFAKYLPRERTDAQRRKSTGYRNGFGQHIDGTREAQNTKREQRAQLRRARIRESIDEGKPRFEGEAYGSKNGAVIDPLSGDDAAIEAEWVREYGGES